MFATNVGSGKKKRDANLRPETAQGMFVSFPRLFSVARKKLPFGACQIGRAYRNEISPRQGMIRLREFSQAEMELFYNPKDRTHPKFDSVKNHTLPLYPADYQESGRKEVLEITTGDAVKKGIIDSELIAYYLAISEKFFEDLGIPRTAIRCRQQLKDERAHYSSETWDVEIDSEDFGWIEVCAIADRTDYDLGSHAALSKQSMEVNIEGEKFTPHVLEASFGVDRPVWCVLEHAFTETEKRTYFAVDKSIAPITVGVFPLVSKDGLPEKAQEAFNLLVDNHFMVQYDEKGSIGRRYARADEIGTPYCITIDHDTLKDNTVTIRERDSMQQKRVKIEELVEKLK
jgi:glycyl-tRNA synthetase